ncbi:hypothetical protein ACR79R_20155 [Sphingobacterium spiritivorum]|uniref:hypothetical protein n=1 Tax=Sphingobacterium spiritivorum TaxID=258 RepID=UPI003DA6542E
MKFVKLTHSVLKDLKRKGYNLLRSVSGLDSEDPTFFPDTTDLEKLFDIDSEELRHINIPMNEVYLLPIDEALKIEESELFGTVFIEE